MYLWIGLGIEQINATKIRKYCRDINNGFVNEQSFTLPQHVSLKTSFKSDNYNNIIKYIKNKYLSLNKIEIEINRIDTIPGVIWLEIKENTKLRKIHNDINKDLKEVFNIELNGYDGKSFKFHSTIFQDTENKESIDILYNKIDNNIFKNKKVTLDTLYFGISEEGKVGTYKVIEYLNLK